MLTVTVNGRPRDLTAPCTIARLLELLQLETARVAVERNRDIVSRDEFEKTLLEEGDCLEIVRFVGGG
jgi:thiamine biosynthesis protein ThiS